MRRSLVVTVLALSLSAGSVFAEIGEGHGEIGLDLGFASLDDNYGDDGTRVIARGGYFFTDRFELEVQAGGAFTNCSDVFCTDLNVWTLNAVFNFKNDQRWVPYVLLGGGYADRPDESLQLGPVLIEVEGGSGAAWQAALGTRMFFGERGRTAFRLEASVLSEDTFDETSTHVNATVGLSWRLGQGR